ncbi:fatty acid desaturase family protein [uncultured Paraglaciecola sp.]|uniref:fatty acid desaturase family protein n=1 Tax=uncultured Paraglaciecola sp. TaxID=1765024 RepID=UPI0030DB1EEB|tara:strand:- start:27234 stop:28130 length:897 start_codon:yes stop_codon:yes gene_type:complete
MKAHDILSRQEILQLMTKNNLRATILIMNSWAWVIAAMALVAIWTNVVTIILAVLIIGGRQLSFAILMHDCGHNSLFKSSKLNQFVGTWLAAAPIFSDMQTYSRQHSLHHKDVGTAKDPDLGNYAGYPVSKMSLFRKILRDLSGLTALKFWFYILKTRAQDNKSMVTNIAFCRGLAVNLMLFLSCYLAHVPWLYLLWLLAYNTTYFLFLRIRHVGEHAAVPNPLSRNMFENTRTTLSSWWERIIVCPVYVNYHIEHHLLPSVPPYNLKKMHNWLVAKGAYKHTPLPSGYIAMLRSVVN